LACAHLGRYILGRKIFAFPIIDSENVSSFSRWLRKPKILFFVVRCLRLRYRHLALHGISFTVLWIKFHFIVYRCTQSRIVLWHILPIWLWILYKFTVILHISVHFMLRLLSLVFKIFLFFASQWILPFIQYLNSSRIRFCPDLFFRRFLFFTYVFNENTWLGLIQFLSSARLARVFRCLECRIKASMHS